MSNWRPNATVAACAALSAVLGSIHAFSVFIPQWEHLPGADRASVSLIYSIALVSLTVAVLFGYQLYQRVAPFCMFLLSGVVGAFGLYATAYGTSLFHLYITYGVIFGCANGLGYGYVLQFSGQVVPKRRGLAMGLVTAFYAMGATIAPPVFTYLIRQGGNAEALKAAGMFVLVVSVTTAALVYCLGLKYQSESPSSIKPLTAVLKRARILLWLAYGCAVTAGLMVIGHAYGIAVWLNLDTGAATWATTIVALANMVGGFSAGFSVDRLSSRALLSVLPLLTSIGLVLLVIPLQSEYLQVLIAIGLVGYCYGAIIAVYPVAVADIFGVLTAPRIYGQIFTAWGLAGFLGPWLSGWLFDQSESYTMALLLAVLLSCLSILAIRQSLPAAVAWSHTR